jgi:hypothetical protein
MERGWASQPECGRGTWGIQMCLDYVFDINSRFLQLVRWLEDELMYLQECEARWDLIRKARGSVGDTYKLVINDDDGALSLLTNDRDKDMVTLKF